LCVGNFWDRIFLYVQDGLDYNPLICASLCNWNDKLVLQCWAIAWERARKLFAWTGLEPWSSWISTSWVVRISLEPLHLASHLTFFMCKHKLSFFF
jgi:hypothetical protein